MRRVLLKALLLALVVSAAVPQPALAYIDPNTGGMLFQLLAVIFASLSAIALIFSRQIRMLFARARRALRSLLKGQSEPGEVESAAGAVRSELHGDPEGQVDADADPGV